MQVSKQPREGGAADELKRHAAEFSALYEASRALSAQTSVASLLRTLMERVLSLLGSASTSVFLYDTAARQVEVVATIGGTLPIGTRFGMNEGVPGRVAQTGQPILVEDYQAWEHRNPKHEATGARAILMVPMTCGGELLGALGVNEYTTERTYNEDDARLLSLFATLAAGTLRTVQLLEEARGRSIELLRDNDERRRIAAALQRSEERFRSLIEGMNDVVFTVGLDGLVTYVSPALERLTGHTPEETIGRPFSAFIHPEDLAALRDSFARVLEGRRDPVEFRVAAKDGETRWVRSSSRRQFEGGVPVGITGSLTDITERKRAEIALRESEVRYRTLIELSPDGIGIHRGGEVVYINSAGVRLMGASDASEVMGARILDFVHADDRAALMARIQRMLETGEPVFHSEWRLVQRGGTVRDVEAVGMPLMYEGAGAIQVVVRDITERKRAADALAESEQRFRMLADASCEAILVHDHGYILDVNRAGLEMTGYSYDEMVGMNGLDLLAPESREAAADRVRDESTERYEAVALRADGTRYHVELMGRAVPYHGRPCRVTAMRDISDRRLAEEALRASEERYRELIENANDLVYVHDLTGNILSINRAAERTTGYSREEVLGRSIAELIVPEDVPRTLEVMHGMASGSQLPPVFEADVMTKDGRRVTLDISARLILRGDVPVAVQGVARDVTDRKRAAEEIRALNDALEQRVHERTAELAAANSELEAFGYSVSHDLRGPLRVIEGFSRMLSDEYGKLLDDDGRRYIDRVQANSQRMAQLIQDLLSLSRITRNAIERQPIDLSAVAQSVADELLQSEPDRRVEFVIAPHAPVAGDPAMLRILVENLLGNAWKYTGKHAAARIEFGVQHDRGEWTHYVRDDGAGFDMEFVGKLFQPFQRLHLSSEFDGTGIGLAIVERIVRRHGGRVWAEGAVERGATFYFTLSPGSPVGGGIRLRAEGGGTE